MENKLNRSSLNRALMTGHKVATVLFLCKTPILGGADLKMNRIFELRKRWNRAAFERGEDTKDVFHPDYDMAIAFAYPERSETGHF